MGEKKLLLSLLIGLLISMFFLFLGTYLSRDYNVEEHNLNSTNPLILDYDFVLCKGKYNWFFSISNIGSKNLTKDSIEWGRICDKKYQKTIGLEYGWYSYPNIDDFFSGQEEETKTNSSIYLLSKLREINGGREILIGITDKGRDKKYIFGN